MGERATALQASLDRLLDSPGVTGVALIDAVTGLTYGAAGDAAEAGTGTEASELVALISERLGEAGAVGELESVVMTSRRRHQVLLRVDRPAGDPLLLAAGLDRDRANVALALRGLGDRAREVLA
ncbi:hypothetical protein PV416_06105 [Streptomyces ipomoeae]|jgi:hypothetical protein|uniref:hypothetical protein n=1 Tax=Streptomyces ipomoeae TaxID=103232 RepID=UPI0002F82F4B|nr:hypothetical protein [Streptomyces ipomoeae]MDX2693290.1 hypothetical protein [Streptomyces ipomoeae]MDX2820670.1 hypothetical protein [Streptomyces ipomoeae]MDX2838753.1 hypothetical protein [Streptomyces ipomoeae]MDX2873178.1 hypothetical protein [Streptomyces ipomoeae]MDX2934172.1 hypothetical protein [Streptomyces ipomoeae]